jgi:hypothetical protein
MFSNEKQSIPKWGLMQTLTVYASIYGPASNSVVYIDPDSLNYQWTTIAKENIYSVSIPG